jgi:hypothetical protein
MTGPAKYRVAVPASRDATAVAYSATVTAEPGQDARAIAAEVAHDFPDTQRIHVASLRDPSDRATLTPRAVTSGGRP